MHIGKEEEEEAREGESHRMIALRDYDLCLTSIVVNGDPSSEVKGKRTCLCLNDSDEQVKIRQVFHCEGLLLCILKDDIRVVVWNPYWGQTRWIKTRFSHLQNGLDILNYALGYEIRKTTCSHKPAPRELPCPPGNLLKWYEIYDFDTDLWTTLDVTPHWRTTPSQAGVSLKGNTYWCASERNSPGRLLDHIICFNFTSERFGKLLHLPSTAQNGTHVTLSCVRDEKLAVMVYYETNILSEIEIWVTTKIEATEMSWTKFLTFSVEHVAGLCFDSFFIDEVKKVTVVFEKILGHDTVIAIGENEYTNQMDLGLPANISCNQTLCPYVPSLVQIKQPAGFKRKRQSSFETYQYKQNMELLALVEKLVDLKSFVDSLSR